MASACWATAVVLTLAMAVVFLGGPAWDIYDSHKRVKIQALANEGTTRRLRASIVFYGTFLEVRFKLSGVHASTARLRTRVVGPSELFLVDLDPEEGNDLRGRFDVARWDQLNEYSIEAVVFTYDFHNDDIEGSVVLTNETYYYQIKATDLLVDDLMRTGFTPTESKARRWILRDAELVDALRCTRKPDAAKWCAPMPDRIWNRYFAAWYIPPLPQELHLEALELFPRVPRTKLGENRRVCFFGDSQMRHLFNNFVMATSDYKALPVISAEKEVMQSDRHRYIQKRWSGFEFSEGQDVTFCTDIVANMGQWPAGWPEGRPWSFLEYHEGVLADMEELQAISKRLGLQPQRLYWVSTNPHGYMDVNGRSMFGPDANEWRWDGVLDEYNRLARLAAEASGVQYLDLSSIVKPLADLAYDGAHYAGVAGDEMAWALIAALTGR